MVSERTALKLILIELESTRWSANPRRWFSYFILNWLYTGIATANNESFKLEDRHWEECKLTPTLTFDFWPQNKMRDYDLSCTIYLPSLVICPVVFVLECRYYDGSASCSGRHQYLNVPWAKNFIKIHSTFPTFVRRNIPTWYETRFLYNSRSYHLVMVLQSIYSHKTNVPNIQHYREHH